ncbi:Gfo/Idh/MocA family oxidoreductase [Nakamurella sp. A5-74]|uniref:Gfo/Idh/MocA family oxidoreductase n=1 Tax=Nakamurella sp. A5-74 TaxID=3158264 RepID=A0AAU8DQD9_9ACTN
MNTIVPTPKLRVGFLSGIRHAVPYAQILADHPRVQLVGVAEDPDTPSWMQDDSASAAATLGIPFFARVQDLLAADAADLVIVCSEPTRHADLAIRALEAGRHVLIDKPVATTVADADRIAAAATASGATVSVVNRLASPAVQRLRRWIDAGHLGLPLHVDVEWFASGAHFATSVERPELVVDPSLSGGGELLNFLLYPVDYIRELTGLETVEIHCEAATLFSAAHKEAGVEDTAIVSLLLQNGVTATVTLGRIPAAPGSGPVSCSIRLLGSHGHAVADDDHPQVTRYGTGTESISAVPVDGPSSTAILRRFLNDHVDAVLDKKPPRYTLAQACASLRVIEAAYASTRSGQPVQLARTATPVLKESP